MNPTLRIATAIVLVVVLAQAAPTRAAEYLSAPDAAALDLPFSEAVRVNGMLFLSGQIGNLPGTTTLAGDGIEGQSRQVMENIKSALGRHGSALDKVVKCTVMIDDIADWPAFNAVYVTYFPGPKPARSAFGADGLAFGARVEVECWAAD